MTTPNEQAVLLQARGLQKNFRMGGEDLQVLRGLDLDVHHGQWLAILGSSGSGKSTLLHLLGGLDRPNQGTVHFQGQEIFSLRGSRLDQYRNRHVGFVFQFYHLLPELDVLENVLLAAMVRRSIARWPAVRAERRHQGRQLLDRLGLSHRMGHRPAKLSGGERQRVAIARALINQPDVLLADEPTGNLDARTGDQILDVLRECHHAGQTIVMVTHDQRVAEAADRKATLHSGRLDDIDQEQDLPINVHPVGPPDESHPPTDR